MVYVWRQAYKRQRMVSILFFKLREWNLSGKETLFSTFSLCFKFLLLPSSFVSTLQLRMPRRRVGKHLRNCLKCFRSINRMLICAIIIIDYYLVLCCVARVTTPAGVDGAHSNFLDLVAVFDSVYAVSSSTWFSVTRFLCGRFFLPTAMTFRGF